MGITERREREREELRTRIVEAARDILSAEGLDGLSIRAIAERIEYSPATIYLYFRDKDELIREVVKAGFERMGAYVAEEVAALGPDPNPVLQFRATGRAYARFAVENTAYFRVMFELPKVARLDCRPPEEAAPAPPCSRDLVGLVTRAADAGLINVGDPAHAALTGWATMHGLVSLYLSGHLVPHVQAADQFFELVEAALTTLWEGWKVDDAGAGTEAVASGGGGRAGRPAPVGRGRARDARV